MSDSSSSTTAHASLTRNVIIGAGLIGIGAMLPYAIDRVRSAISSDDAKRQKSDSKSADPPSQQQQPPKQAQQTQTQPPTQTKQTQVSAPLAPTPAHAPLIKQNSSSGSSSTLLPPSSKSRRASRSPQLGPLSIPPTLSVPIHALPSLRVGSPARAFSASPVASPSPYPSPTPSPRSPYQAPIEEDAVMQLVRRDFPLWRDCAPLAALPDDAFTARPLTGGSSNTLWLCQLTEEAAQQLEEQMADADVSLPPTDLVIRFYGQSLDTLIDRSTEADVAELLSRAGIGARIYWHFRSPQPGRIEQFISGRVLRFDELDRDDVARPIARELARLHCTQVPHAAATASAGRPVVFDNLLKYFKAAMVARAETPGVGLDFDPDSSAARDDIYSLDAQNALAASLGLPDLRAVLRRGEWDLERINALDLAAEDDASLPDFIRDNRWFKEIRWLSRVLANWQSATYKYDGDSSATGADRSAKQERFLHECMAFSQAGLCHNDLNPGNIIYYEDGADLPDAHASVSASVSMALGSGVAASTLPPAFTLIDFEYAALNLPQFDLANHLCERSLEYSDRSWPFFFTHHQRTFPKQDSMRRYIDHYSEEKSIILSCPVTASSSAHLYVSTLTAMLASHLLWSLWGVIQSASVAHSSTACPSWDKQADGKAFPQPPLAFLEYSELRFELYSSVKRLWLQHNYAESDGAFGPPPRWQAMTDADDWRIWVDQLDDLHDDVRNLQLRAEQRQRAALRRYELASKKKGTSTPNK